MRIGDAKEAVKLALDTLRKNKLRSGLTILGISIGIATVILISSAINGLNSNIDHFISTLGTNDLWVFHFRAVRPSPYHGRTEPQEADLRGRHGDARIAACGRRRSRADLPEFSDTAWAASR